MKFVKTLIVWVLWNKVFEKCVATTEPSLLGHFEKKLNESFLWELGSFLLQIESAHRYSWLEFYS